MGKIVICEFSKQKAQNGLQYISQFRCETIAPKFIFDTLRKEYPDFTRKHTRILNEDESPMNMNLLFEEINEEIRMILEAADKIIVFSEGDKRIVKQILENKKIDVYVLH